MTAELDFGTHAGRQRLIDNLVASLSSSEWRDLQKRLNARSWACDIFFEVPWEVKSEILEHLNALDLVRLRRVSRQWHFILCSDFICKPALSRLFGDELELVMTKTATAATTLRSLTRQAHTFRYGRPCDVTPLMHLIEDEDESFPCDDNAIAYHTGKLAWVISTLDGGDHRIRVHDLRKQLTYEVDAAARSSVEVLAVSETILGYVTTRGYCYAIAHSTRNSRRFRLPSSRVLHLSIRKSKILLLFKIGSASDVLLCKYDYDTGKAVDIKLECRNHPTPGKPVKAFFRSSQETIFIFFERQGLDSIHKILSVGEFSLDGLLLSPRFTDIAGFQDQWRACCNPASYDDLFTITLEPSEETHWPYDTFEETIFQYNGSVDQVLVRKAVRPATNGKAEWGWSSMFPTIHPRFIWKDTMYAWSVNRDSRMLYASSLDGGTSSQGVNQCVALTYPAFASGQMVGQGGHREPHNFGDKFETLWLGGDSKFVFQIGQRESYLWCFDKDF